MKANRPLAVAFAAAMFAMLWVPTLSMPAHATSATAVPLVELA